MNPGSALLVLAACLMPGVGHTAPEDSLNYAVGTSMRYDNNLFRLSSSTPAPSSSKSDMLYTAHAGIRVDKSYALQRFQLDATATQYSFRSNDYLNFTGLDYRAAWLWSVTPRLTGSLSADRTAEMTSYTNLQNFITRNKRTIENQGITGDWLVDGGWHLIGGVVRQRSLTDSRELTSFGNYVQNTAEGGIKYVSAANNSISAIRRESRGDYLGRPLDALAQLDTRYDQHESELRATYQVTGHSRLNARLGFRDRTHQNFSTRNFSGTVGALGYEWQPTGKLQFLLTAGRDLIAYQESANSYYLSNFVSLTPTWLLSDKTTVRVKLDFSQNNYRGAVVPVSSMRDDTVRSAQFGVAWRPLRTVIVDGYLTREERSSNFSGIPYHANIVGLSASGTF